jgi:hypothetical protein
MAQDDWAPPPRTEGSRADGGSITSSLPSYATAPVGWGSALSVAPISPPQVQAQPVYASAQPAYAPAQPAYAPASHPGFDHLPPPPSMFVQAEPQFQTTVMPTWAPPTGPAGPTFAGPAPQYGQPTGQGFSGQPGFLPPAQGYGPGQYPAPQKSSAGKTVAIVIAVILVALLSISAVALLAVASLGSKVKSSFEVQPSFNTISNTLPAYDEYTDVEPVLPTDAAQNATQAPALLPTPYEAGIGLVSTDLIIRNANGPAAEYSSCVTFEPNTASYVSVPCAAPHNGEFVISLSGRTKAEVAQNCVQNAVSQRPLTTPENVWLVEYPSGVTECFLVAPAFDPTRFDELGTSAFS